MISFLILSFVLWGCTPTCEQTCKKLLSCETIVTSEMECENACNAQEQLFDDWAEAEEAEQEAKTEEEQERENATDNGETYAPSKTTSQATQQIEDESPSSKYQDAFDAYKTCISEKTCGEIIEGDCYNEDIYSW